MSEMGMPTSTSSRSQDLTQWGASMAGGCSTQGGGCPMARSASRRPVDVKASSHSDTFDKRSVRRLRQDPGAGGVPNLTALSVLQSIRESVNHVEARKDVEEKEKMEERTWTHVERCHIQRKETGNRQPSRDDTQREEKRHNHSLRILDVRPLLSSLFRLHTQ